MQAIPGCIPLSLIFTFLPDFLITDLGMAPGGTAIVQGVGVWLCSVFFVVVAFVVGLVSLSFVW